MGRLALTGAGRMMAVLCDGRTSMPEGEKRVYSSYCGNYRVEADTLTTTVDAAAVVERIGSKQVRKLELRDGRLVLYSLRAGPTASSANWFGSSAGRPDRASISPAAFSRHPSRHLGEEAAVRSGS